MQPHTKPITRNVETELNGTRLEGILAAERWTLISVRMTTPFPGYYMGGGRISPYLRSRTQPFVDGGELTEKGRGTARALLRQLYEALQEALPRRHELCGLIPSVLEKVDQELAGKVHEDKIKPEISRLRRAYKDGKIDQRTYQFARKELRDRSYNTVFRVFLEQMELARELNERFSIYIPPELIPQICPKKNIEAKK